MKIPTSRTASTILPPIPNSNKLFIIILDLIISIIFLIISIIYLLPNEKAIVKKDTNVYILPTRNSTIFFKSANSQNVEILDRKNGFIKVLGIDNEFIGWIKEESLGTN